MDRWHSIVKAVCAVLGTITVLFPLGMHGATDYISELSKADSLRRVLEHDSAFKVYRSIAANYRSGMPHQQKMQCLDAVYGCIETSLSRGNFTDVSNYLILAEDIHQSENLDEGKLHHYYAGFYLTLGSHTLRPSVFELAFVHAEKAFDYSLDARDMEKTFNAFGNVINLWFTLEKTKEHNHVMERVAKRFDREMPETWKKRYMQDFLSARKAELQNDHKRATFFYDKSMSSIPEGPETAPLRIHMWVYSSLSKLESGDSGGALAALDSAMATAAGYRFPTMRYIIMKQYQSLYASLGDSTKVRLYGKEMVGLKDSLSSYAVADEFYSFENAHQQRELRNEVFIARYRQKVMVWILGFVAIVAAVTIVFLLLLRKKNRKLRERARLLHDMLSGKTAELLIPRKEKEEVPEEEPIAVPDEETAVAREEEKAPMTKYGGSNLSEDDKREIAGLIQSSLDSNMVFRTDFSLAVLAQSVGKSTKAVSQVVNEVFGVNFSTMVNRIRIYEACRRMDSPRYAEWSVEGIAESVGYTQRATFSSNFKKITGMGIREYRRLSEKQDARKEQKS